ncbi:MAG: hypothetical protein MJ119_02890, partial [Lachnospiraceae bacterium]|nr:hypothetical protein [Lachnospiraceae bacterium]
SASDFNVGFTLKLSVADLSILIASNQHNCNDIVVTCQTFFLFEALLAELFQGFRLFNFKPFHKLVKR